MHWLSLGVSNAFDTTQSAAIISWWPLHLGREAKTAVEEKSISLNHSSIHAAPALYTGTNEKRQWKINNARGWPSMFILLHWIGLLIERAHSITARGKMTNDSMTNVHLSFDFSEFWRACFIEQNFFNHCALKLFPYNFQLYFRSIKICYFEGHLNIYFL